MVSLFGEYVRYSLQHVNLTIPTGAKTPGIVVPLTVMVTTGNVIGPVLMGGAKVAMEATGKTKIEGAAKQTAEAIADQLRLRFKEQGWIQ